MKVYQWLRKFLPIFVVSIAILNINSCSKKLFEEKPDDSNAKSFWLYWLTIDKSENYYNNCPPINAILDPGVHTISLSDGQEYWFDISAKAGLSNTNSYAYLLEIKYEPSNTLYFFAGNCMVSPKYPQPTFTPKYLLSEKYMDGGGFYRVWPSFPPNSQWNYYLMGIRLQGSTGTVTIKLP